jgi:hypothetical protein
MKYTKISVCFFSLIICCLTIKAQNVIPASGGNGAGAGGSVSYTVGQVANATLSGSGGTVAQGVQQPYEISVVTAIKNTEEINLKCYIYPNPAADVTKLVFESPEYENMRFRLFDINGVLLQDKTVDSRETEIYLGNSSSSVYFLKVLKDNLEVKVFKIIKK